MTTTTALLTTRQAAERLGVDRGTVSRAAAAGRLPAAGKLPGRTGAYLFDVEVIDDAAREWKRQEANA
jgi:excisionase family DNA binding protein